MSYKLMPPVPAPPPSAVEDENKTVKIITSMHILLKIGGAISCISSFLLARHILKKKKTWADISLTSLMLVGISVINMIGSFFGYFMGGWMMGESDFVQSSLLSGNQQTCTAQGFLLTFSFTYFVTAYAGLGALCE
jgi:hypothetical protein